MDEILSKPLMVSFNIDLKLDNEEQNERACKGLSFVVNKKYKSIDGIDCCLLTLEITEGDVINVIAEEPASISSIHTSSNDHKFQFIINDFPKHMNPYKIIDFKLEFQLKPKILNCCSWSENVQVPYLILKNLNFGEYYRHDIKLLENRSITLNGYWCRKEDEWGRFVYEYCLINKNGIKIQDQNDDFIHTISANYFQDDDFYARKVEDETFHIEFFIDLDAVQKDVNKMKKGEIPSQSPPAKDVLNSATQIGELEAWMRSTTIYDAYELFKRSQKTKETTPPSQTAETYKQSQPNNLKDCNLCEGLCFCSDKKRFDDVLSKFISKASSDDVHNLSYVLNILKEDGLKRNAEFQDESAPVESLEVSTETKKPVETKNNQSKGTFFNDTNQNLQNAMADIQNSMNILTNIFSNFKKTDRALQPKIATSVTQQIKGMTQAWQERHPGWENGIWDFNDTKNENDDLINDDSADDLVKSVPFLNRFIINDKKEIESADKVEEAYVIDLEENEIQPITDFMNKDESCCSSTGSWVDLDSSELEDIFKYEFCTPTKSPELLTESSKSKTQSSEKPQNQAHEKRIYRFIGKPNELAAINRKIGIAATESDLEAIEEMLSTKAFQEIQHSEKHETFFDALDGQNSSSVSKNEAVESNSQKISDIRKKFGGYNGILEELKMLKEKSLADKQSLFESNFLKPFQPLKSPEKSFSSPDNVLFKTFDGHSVQGRQSELSNISPILKNIFEESTEKPCEINVTFDGETMHRFINYSRGIKSAIKNYEFKLYKVAQEFGIDGLKTKCIESFEEQMNPSGYDPEGIEARRENIKKLFETT